MLWFCNKMYHQTGVSRGMTKTRLRIESKSIGRTSSSKMLLSLTREIITVGFTPTDALVRAREMKSRDNRPLPSAASNLSSGD